MYIFHSFVSSFWWFGGLELSFEEQGGYLLAYD